MAMKVLDSYALLVFLQDEPGAQTVEDLILEAQKGSVTLAMCVVNLGEIWYSIARTSSTETADKYVQQILSLPIEIVDADWLMTRHAAEFKTQGNISYADCYVGALAKVRKGEVVTGDREFEVIENDVKVFWLK
jgi:predicted nucleic acid-binding protein